MINGTIFTLWTVVKAYQYTSLTSVMLLDCWSIPCVMLLTWIFLKTKYRYKKITGVIVCIAGLVLVVFSDVHAGDRAGKWLHIYTSKLMCVRVHSRYLYSRKSYNKQNLIDPIFCLIMSYSHILGGSNPRKGDILVIAGATLYAFSNVSEVSW